MSVGSALSRWTLLRCSWRSLFLQAGFSTESMQSLGFLYALAPALERLYPDEAQRRAAFSRHPLALQHPPLRRRGHRGRRARHRAAHRAR